MDLIEKFDSKGRSKNRNAKKVNNANILKDIVTERDQLLNKRKKISQILSQTQNQIPIVEIMTNSQQTKSRQDIGDHQKTIKKM